MASSHRNRPLVLKSGLEIPAAELAVEQALSGGPGGQHVNKAATKVVLRFSVSGSLVFEPEDRTRLLERLGSRLTRAGEVVIHSERFRSADRNLADARKRLAELLDAGLMVPKVRRPSRPSAGSRARRIDSKKRRSQVKRTRRSQIED